MRAVILALATLAACADPTRPTDGRPPTDGTPVTEAPPVPDSLALPVVPGGHLWLHGDARDSLGTPADTQVRFSVEDSAVATVDDKGQVAGRRPGRTVVAASAAGRTVRLAVVVRTVRYREVYPAMEGGGCALTTDGEALCWGPNDDGILGAETLRSCAWVSPSQGYRCGSWPSEGPTFVRTRARFATLAVGWGRRCGLTAGGRALCWGASVATPADVPCADTLSRGRCDYAPREEPGVSPWSALQLGALRFAGSTCALDATGAPWCRGYDGAGGEGAPGLRTVAAPVAVPGAPPLRVLSVGPAVSCGLDAEDAVWCWGYTPYFGNDTLGAGAPSSATRAVRAADGMRFAALSMLNGGCGLTGAGDAWCWWFGERPRRAAPGLRLATISAGDVSACGLTAEGEGWCWPYARPPQPIAGGLRFRTLSVKGYGACGMGLDGRAYCLRYQANGEDPSATTIGAPQPLAGQP